MLFRPWKKNLRKCERLSNKKVTTLQQILLNLNTSLKVTIQLIQTVENNYLLINIIIY